LAASAVVAVCAASAEGSVMSKLRRTDADVTLSATADDATPTSVATLALISFWTVVV